MTQTPSSISIKLDGVDITDKVLFKETTFTSQANPVQGTFRVVVKDADHTFWATAGEKVTLHIDGIPLFGGYVMRIGRGFFFPVEDSSTPADVVRKWTLEGPDFNILFDKRVTYDGTDITSALEVPSGQRTISQALTYLMNNYVDVPSGLDYSTYVDTVTTGYGTEADGSLYVGQGKTLRAQMEDFKDHGAVMYYIDADFNLHLHEYESANVSWLFTDKDPDGVSSMGFREGTFRQDYGQIVTDALVWGGSSIRAADGGPAGDIVFARYPDPPANTVTWYNKLHSAEREQAAIDRQAQYGVWQRGEERAGQANYLTKHSVKNRAFNIIQGPPGHVPTDGVESGFSKPMTTMTCSWFAHDVPGGEHVRPGYIADFVLYTQGPSGSALVRSLPLRQMRVSFPALPSDSPGDTWVRFDGDFGVSFSDRRYMWTALRESRSVVKEAIVVADNTTTSSIPPGSQITVWPNETPDGINTVFTFPYVFFEDRMDLFMNGLAQRAGIDYIYNASLQQVTFVVAPGIGDQIWAVGFGS